MVTYLVYTCKQVFELKLFTAFWKTLLLFAGFFFTSMIIMGSVIIIAHIVDYEPLMINLTNAKQIPESDTNTKHNYLNYEYAVFN